MRIGGRTVWFRRRRWGSRRLWGRRPGTGLGRPAASGRMKLGSSGGMKLSSNRGMKLSSGGGRKPGSGGRKRSGFHLSRRKIWLLVVVLFIAALIQGFAYVDRNMKEPLVQLAKVRVKQIATESLNEAITEQVANGKQYGDLIDWKTDSSGKITGFMLNYKTHMEITSETVQTVRATLERVSKLHETIPVGQALGSPLLASFGPRVPIRIEPQSDVKVDLDTRKQDAGINSILVEVYLHIRTEVSIIVPFNMGPQAVEMDIPVSYLMVVGDVPMYYYDNKGNPVGDNGANAPSIALPSVPSGSSSQPSQSQTSPGSSANGGQGGQTGTGQ